jgi:hypothetical protein
MRLAVVTLSSLALVLVAACGSGDAATEPQSGGGGTPTTTGAGGGAGTTTGETTSSSTTATTTSTTSTTSSSGSGGAGHGGVGHGGAGGTHGAGGAQGTGTITGTTGGKLDRFSFSVVGDTRPPIPNDTLGYPTDIITKIWEDIAAASPKPAFAIGTGDYASSIDILSQAAKQVDLYMGARAAFDGPFFPAMGNHECTVATTSNCGPGTANGVTKNYQNFLDKMLAPVGVDSPYYTVEVESLSGDWTMKLVYVAPNAWTDAQAAWLEAELAKPTTYTFVVRHEHYTATDAPGTTPSQAIIEKHPYTLLVSGHTHTYAHHPMYKEILVGNGGAPLVDNVDYGYVIVRQRPDGDVQITSYAYQDNHVVDDFTLHADGSPAP